ANLIVQEAAGKNVAWDGIYLIGAEIAGTESGDADVIRWLEQGLRYVPQSSRLWVPYYLLMARQGKLTSIPTELRQYPRGIQSVISLSKRLQKEGFIPEALE